MPILSSVVWGVQKCYLFWRTAIINAKTAFKKVTYLIHFFAKNGQNLEIFLISQQFSSFGPFFGQNVLNAFFPIWILRRDLEFFRQNTSDRAIFACLAKKNHFFLYNRCQLKLCLLGAVKGFWKRFTAFLAEGRPVETAPRMLRTFFVGLFVTTFDECFLDLFRTN